MPAATTCASPRRASRHNGAACCAACCRGALWPYLETGLGHYLLLMAAIVPLLGLLLGLLYYHELHGPGRRSASLSAHAAQAFLKAFAALLLVSGIVAWWLVLTHKSRQVAQEESNRQTHLLMQEIDSHRRTDEQLQKAKQVADLANQAKSRYITAISHELRTPLNSILGYAQILDGDESIPAAPPRRRSTSIRKSGDHLLSLIEGTLDIARIEGGKLTLEPRPLDFADFLRPDRRHVRTAGAQQGPRLRLPADGRTARRGARRRAAPAPDPDQRARQRGQVHRARRRHAARSSYQREMATFEIEDTGPGIAPDELERIFEPFVRGSSGAGRAPARGLGLTIAACSPT